MIDRTHHHLHHHPPAFTYLIDDTQPHPPYKQQPQNTTPTSYDCNDPESTPTQLPLHPPPPSPSSISFASRPPTAPQQPAPSNPPTYRRKNPPRWPISPTTLTFPTMVPVEVTARPAARQATREPQLFSRLVPPPPPDLSTLALSPSLLCDLFPRKPVCRCCLAPLGRRLRSPRLVAKRQTLAEGDNGDGLHVYRTARSCGSFATTASSALGSVNISPAAHTSSLIEIWKSFVWNIFLILKLQQIDETVGVMRENITKVADRGARLDTLQDKTGMSMI